MVITALRIGAERTIRLVPARITILQNATLTGRSTRGGPLKLREGFPWDKKRISKIRAWWDTTKYHITEENAKLIVVDGPIAAGKTPLAKAIAEEFDMRYFPEPTMDEYWINPYGFDLRTLDDKVPEILTSWDEKTFNMDPKNIRKSINVQMIMIQLRYLQYVDALAHIMNTGQGAVLDRSYFSDRVFTHSMFDEGYISKDAKKYYDWVVFNTHWTLMRPHVVIYLDVPVPIVQERIKARNLSWEVNGKALTPSFLHNMEKHYKQHLKEMNKHGDLLVYDWSEGGEVETVVEDLEELNFEDLDDIRSDKYRDWKMSRIVLLEKRLDYTNNVCTSKDTDLMNNFNCTPYDVDELWFDYEDCYEHTHIVKSYKTQEYDIGYNPDAGDNVWFKTKDHNHRRPKWHVHQDYLLD